MQRFRGLDRAAKGFAADSRGNFAIVFGLAAAALVLGVGYAVDTAQLVNAKSALREAVDAAVTSTARDLTTGTATEDEAKKIVEAFLSANSTGGALAYNGIKLDGLAINRTAKTLEATAHVDVPLYFPLFGRGNVERVSETSTALYSNKRIEVALMLDLTGSMRGQKIKDLRTAAGNAVEAMLGSQKPGIDRVRVALVPYAEAVNTGGLADSVFVEVNGGPTLPPSIDDPIPASAGAGSRPDRCSTERRDKDGEPDFSDDGPETIRWNNQGKRYLAKVNRDRRMTKCPSAALIPLTADRQKLLNTISTFSADGVTAGGIAAQWGYYMLSPRWRNTVRAAGLGDGPADYAPDKVSKVAILMTDGAFNTAFAGVSGTPQNLQQTKSSANAQAICANMKAGGIEVYTIGFDLGSNKSSEKVAALAVLKNCASPDTNRTRHFFDASTGPELDAAFKEIAGNIEKLVLTR
jgi:Flp pilus assembly protein TadG